MTSSAAIFQRAQGRLRTLGAILLLCLTSADLRAESDFQFSGFGTLGVSSEHEDNLGFLRDSTQNKRPDSNTSLAPDSQLGLQLSYRFNPQWHATTQMVYADKAEYTANTATELAFLGYSPVPDIDIRAGRVAVDMFQLSDFRRVDYANLWVRPPRELYSWIIPSYINGGDIAKSFITGDVYWRIKAQYGSTEPTIESPDGSQQFETEFNRFMVATLTADLGNWGGRLSFSRFTTADSVPGFVTALSGIGMAPGPVGAEARTLAERIGSSAKRNVFYTEAALRYDDGLWQVATEIARLSTSSALVPTGVAGYISVARRFATLTPYLVYSRFHPDTDPFISQADWSRFPGAEGLKNAALGTLNGPLINQQTWAIGVRWDVARKIAIKAQWDRSSIRQNTYALWAFTSDKSQADATVDVASLALNFIF